MTRAERLGSVLRRSLAIANALVFVLLAVLAFGLTILVSIFLFDPALIPGLPSDEQAALEELIRRARELMDARR